MKDELKTELPARTYPGLAWLVILALLVLVFWRQQALSAQRSESGDELGLLFQGRMVVGLAQFSGREQAAKSLAALETGPYRQRLLVAILVGTINGPEAVGPYLTQLEELRAGRNHAPTPAEERLRQALEHIYINGPGKAGLTDADRGALAEAGWFGDLARVGVPRENLEGRDPKGAALRSFAAVIAIFGMGLLLAVVGFVLLIVFVVLWSQGQWRWSVEPRPGGGLYAETFAVWFVLFLGLNLAGKWLPGLNGTAGGAALTLLSILLALLWPVLRGRDGTTVRGELGLYSGQSIGREILAGLATYAACLPLLVVAAFAIWGLTNGYTQWRNAGAPPDPFAPSNRPSHPATELVLGNLWTLLSLYFATAVVAPLAEETAFRGILQRHLRGFLGRLSSAVVVGLIFAVLHPQGLLGVPALLALAVVFSLAREWRGSLIAPMTAHALNNGVVATLLLVATR